MEISTDNLQSGVCYLNRIPPQMTVSFVRQMLEKFDINRIYFVPQNKSQIKSKSKKQGPNKSQKYSYGWIEFKNKEIAKYVAQMLNNQKIQTKKRGSIFNEETWCIKYLPKFKWNDLQQIFTQDQQLKKQKLNLALSQATQEKEVIQQRSDESKKINAIFNV